MNRLLLFMIKLFNRKLYQNIEESALSQNPIKANMWFFQKILGFNRKAQWPMHHTSIVTGSQNVKLGVDTAPGYMPGCYIQAIGKISIGDYTQISSNVGLITANHKLHDSRQHNIENITIGSYCWIGMNSVILPGVTLGDHTVVGAGSVVTKSFPEGNCVIAGNPAKIIKFIDESELVKFENKNKFIGYNKCN